MRYVAIFTVYTFLSAFGLYKIKVAESYLDLHFLVGFSCYLAGFLIWFYILRITPLSVAFPVAAGLLMIATSLFGVLLLNEAYNFYKLVGGILIFAGIVFISISTRATG